MDMLPLLESCVQQRASDLHLASHSVPRLRINGQLQAMNLPPLSQTDLEKLLQSLLNESQLQLFQQQKDFDLAITIPDIGRFRVNIMQQLHGPSAVFRYIPEHIPSINELQLPPLLTELINLSQGLILVTGATGSGKSTTLAAMIHHFNQQQAKHIITLEDPIEFIYPAAQALINQRELTQHTLSFQNALRAALRQDPDIILVGELRDTNTIKLALTAAETGHLVLATLHTASAVRTIHRIIDVFPANEQSFIRCLLAESLQAVICQTLLPRLNSGQIAALEIMVATPAIRNLIRDNKTTQLYSAIQMGRSLGMQTLEQHLQELALQGIIGPINPTYVGLQ